MRAILAKLSFYIFDEITASLDKENEKIIIDLVRELAKDTIVVVITHKMKQVPFAN